MQHVRRFCDLNQNCVSIRFRVVSATVILLYDSILCLPEEVRLIWTKKLSPSKILYCLDRYVVLAFFLYLSESARTFPSFKVPRHTHLM